MFHKNKSKFLNISIRNLISEKLCVARDNHTLITRDEWTSSNIKSLYLPFLCHLLMHTGYGLECVGPGQVRVRIRFMYDLQLFLSQSRYRRTLVSYITALMSFV
jgi:hypothetical protein